MAPPPARSSIRGRSGGRSACPSDPEWAAAGHGDITSPAWLAPIPHPLIVALALPLSLAWWWRAGHDRPREDALALFALLALERCLLDPWNMGYYHLPLVLALVAWETEKRRPPVIALVGDRRACG